jgi:hypothetical protein
MQTTRQSTVRAVDLLAFWKGDVKSNRDLFLVFIFFPSCPRAADAKSSGRGGNCPLFWFEFKQTKLLTRSPDPQISSTSEEEPQTSTAEACATPLRRDSAEEKICSADWRGSHAYGIGGSSFGVRRLAAALGPASLLATGLGLHSPVRELARGHLDSAQQAGP